VTDVRLRITKVQRHERGFFTANVTVAGEDTVRVDNAIGCWTIPRDASANPGDRNINRREILPQFAALLWKRVRAFERGEHHDEVEESANGRQAPAPAPSAAPRRPKPVDAPVPYTQQLAARMAEAASKALKEHAA
jgi:hypothetical protein